MIVDLDREKGEEPVAARNRKKITSIADDQLTEDEDDDIFSGQSLSAAKPEVKPDTVPTPSTSRALEKEPTSPNKTFITVRDGLMTLREKEAFLARISGMTLRDAEGYLAMIEKQLSATPEEKIAGRRNRLELRRQRREAEEAGKLPAESLHTMVKQKTANEVYSEFMKGNGAVPQDGPMDTS